MKTHKSEVIFIEDDYEIENFITRPEFKLIKEEIKIIKTEIDTLNKEIYNLKFNILNVGDHLKQIQFLFLIAIFAIPLITTGAEEIKDLIFHKEHNQIEYRFE